jgi:hypothetical protein
MESIGSVVTVVFLVALWVAAVLFGRDSRDGRDWFARTDLRARPHRIGA